MRECNRCKRTLPEKDFYPSYLRRKLYVCRDCVKHTVNKDYIVGGWKIIYLNHVKSGEFRFQALNTDGRFYQTNDPIEIYSILEDIFSGLCENQK